jgi:hypothetical protein
MIGLGALSVAAPWALAGLVALPLIWWLLKLRPPVPSRVVFPPLELLRKLVARRESPVRIPPWLLLLRLLMAALFVAGLAQPLLDAESRLYGSGPLYLIVDDDWAAAGRWPQRRTAMLDFIDDAARSGRPVVALRTAPPPEGAQPAPVQLMTGANARRLVEGIQPRPWSTDRRAAVERLLEWAAGAERRPGDVIWLSNGIEAKGGPSDASMAELTRRLRPLGAIRILADAPSRAPVILRPPRNTGGELMLVADRPTGSGEELPARGIAVRGLDEDGQLLARVPLVFAAGAARAEALLELPAELRNRLARLEITGAESAAAVVLVDERWRRRPVGLILRSVKGGEQPLLDPNHYLLQALAPFTEVRRGSVVELLQRPTAVLIMADGDTPAPEERTPLTAWLDKGGILVRFAGPNLAREAGEEDKFLPVRLRRGNRVIGGALSWRKPESLAPFPETGPFHGLAVPPDVRVRRQVLAEPSLDLAGKTWARLADGTPLVTAEKHGEGWLVLVHTTADGTWADLSFSGLFVDMLRRLVDLSQGVAGTGGAGALAPPVSSLDAFGTLGAPPGGATAINTADIEAGRVGPGHPPGFYGDVRQRRALNLGAGLQPVAPLASLAGGVTVQAYGGGGAVDLRPWLLAAGAFLFLLDALISLTMRGLVRFRRVALVLALLVAMPTVAVAQEPRSVPALGGSGQSYGSGPEGFAMRNSLETRLAYVLTGDRQVDEVSRAGLAGLNTILGRRTAAELGSPQGVDPASDELAFFPMIYWPVLGGTAISNDTAERVREYLRNGGTILFDTREQTDDGGAGFRILAEQLALPPLVPVDANHVLTRSFYLLREFPGRWTGGAVWVEKAGERVNDGVSPVIAGSHDWAAAWAMDDAQRPMFAVVPGGERQREMAYRFGINLVMYTLTGNYKADQVHMPAIIRRLGQ